MLSKPEISATELDAVAERIKLLRQKATEHAVEIGRELLRVKESLPHGAFVRWIERACEFKIRTAQDLMKLAKSADANAQLVALMMPSTLRVYLAKTTTTDVRRSVIARLDNGERVSRSDVRSAVSTERARRMIEAGRGTGTGRTEATVVADLLTPDGATAGLDGDRSRKVAELLLRRLSKEDYDYVMDGMTWGTWNRIFVWMRAAQASWSRGSQPVSGYARGASTLVGDVSNARR